MVADEEVPQGRATSLALVGPICPRAPSTDPASYQPLAMSHLPGGAGPSISSDRLSPASGTEDTTPRLTAEDKQKSRMTYSDDQGEQDHEMGEDPGRSPTPRPQEQQRVSSVHLDCLRIIIFSSTATRPTTIYNVFARPSVISLSILFRNLCRS